MYTEYNRLPEKCNNPDEQALASATRQIHYAIRAGQAARLLAESEQNAALILNRKVFYPKTVCITRLFAGGSTSSFFTGKVNGAPPRWILVAK